MGATVEVPRGCRGAATSVECDLLAVDDRSQAEAVPRLEIVETATSVHRSTRVAKLSAEEVFYLRSRGLDREQALAMLVNGFLEPFTCQLPMEYGVELKRLIEMEAA